MLVNASSYSDTQKSIADVLWDYVQKISNGLKASTGLKESLAEQNSFYSDIKGVFDKNFQNSNDFDWQDIKKIIHKVASKIDVVHINRLKTSEKLNYEEFLSWYTSAYRNNFDRLTDDEKLKWNEVYGPINKEFEKNKPLG